jgi:hypothetical protein
MDTARQLREAIADLFADAELLVEKVQAAHADRVRELLWEPDERDDDLWEDALDAAGFDVEDWIDVSFPDVVSDTQRDVDWQVLTASFIAAADAQADAEILLRPLLQMANRYSSKIRNTASSVASDVLRSVGKDGIGKREWTTAKERRAMRTREDAE